MEVNPPFSGASNAGKHDGIFWVVVEPVYCIASFFQCCGAVYATDIKAAGFKCSLDEVEHFGPVGEYDAERG